MWSFWARNIDQPPHRRKTKIIYFGLVAITTESLSVGPMENPSCFPKSFSPEIQPNSHKVLEVRWNCGVFGRFYD